MSILNRPYFRDEQAAHAFLEGILWPEGPECPHCGVVGTAYKIAPNPTKRVRYGLWKCRDCRKQFTCKVGTVFEHARIPLHKALQAVYLLCSSKKGISSNQLSRGLEISLKAAWFLSHRVREAMRELHVAAPLGGEGKTVEFDETYIGGKETNKHRSKRLGIRGGQTGKEIAFALVERGGKVRGHHVPSISAKTLRPILQAQIDAASVVVSDDGGSRVGREFPRHQSINHSIGEYVRGDIHTNTIEGYFSILKRGITGVYPHVSPQHLKRYVAEFDFRYNNRVALGIDDFDRTMTALLGVKGKRLTYSQTANDGKSAVCCRKSRLQSAKRRSTKNSSNWPASPAQTKAKLFSLRRSGRSLRLSPRRGSQRVNKVVSGFGDMTWHIEGYDGTEQILEQQIPLDQADETKICEILKLLAAKHLTAAEVKAGLAEARQDTTNANRIMFMAGQNPHYVASLWRSDEK